MFKKKHIDTHNLMNCSHLMDEGLALAADALRSDRFEELPDGVQDHLGECQECRMAVMEIYQAIEASGDSYAEELPPYFVSKKESRERKKYVNGGIWMKVAAAILLLLIPFASIYWNNAAKHIQTFGYFLASEMMIPQHDPFKPDPLMEPMANMVFRGSNVEILSPLLRDELKAGQPIIFQWINKIPEPVRFSLQDNTGKMIAHIHVYRENLKISSLAPGRYYWKLEVGKELLYLGSFIVSSD